MLHCEERATKQTCKSHCTCFIQTFCDIGVSEGVELLRANLAHRILHFSEDLGIHPYGDAVKRP